MARIYLASPYGFARSTEPFLATLRERLRQQHEVIDPWEESKELVSHYFPRAAATDSFAEKKRLLYEMDYKLSERNRDAIRGADVVVAGLDGTDVDSGTASEVGFAYGCGKRIFGYRNDYRASGENVGMDVNPQVQYWVEASGGRICSSVTDLETALAQIAGKTAASTSAHALRLPTEDASADLLETRRSSREALKAIYYVIVGLALAQGLDQTFIGTSGFLGFGVLLSGNLPRLLLLAAFTFTIIRFVHGASIHIDGESSAYKPLVDFVGFSAQGILFYLMALSLDNEARFSYFFVIMLAIDALWLLFLGGIGYIRLRRTERQWIWSDVLLSIGLLASAMLFTPGTRTSSGIVLGLAVVATVADYLMNLKFYFPRQTLTG